MSTNKFIVFFLLVCSFTLSGCKKEVATPTPTPCPICPVCPVCPVAPTKEQILVKKPWQVDDAVRNVSGTNSRYIRGGINTTGINYAITRIIFNADGTGSYIDEVGITHTATWQFTTPDKYNMQFTIGPPSAQTFTWNLVEITESTFSQTTIVGSNTLVTARYVQVP